MNTVLLSIADANFVGVTPLANNVIANDVTVALTLRGKLVAILTKPQPRFELRYRLVEHEMTLVDASVHSVDAACTTDAGAAGKASLASTACSRCPRSCHQTSSSRVSVFGEPVPSWARTRSMVGRSPARNSASAAALTSSWVMPGRAM